MPDPESIENQVAKRYIQRDKKLAPAKMKVTGKSVFTLQKLSATHPPKLKKRKK